MSFHWTIGALAAVLVGTLFFVGVASAHEGSLQGDPTCRDAEGSWSVLWTVTTTIVGEADYVVDIDVDVNDGLIAPSLHLGDFDASLQDTGNTSGTGTTTYGALDDPHTSEHGANGVNELTGNIDYIEWADGFSTGGADYGVSNIITQPGYCQETACFEGEFVEQPVNEPSSSDCDPVRICLDGESMTVTEHEADQLQGATDGSCTPSEPPPPTVTVEPEPTPTAEPVAVAEVSPAIEVAALPAAGYGETSTGFAWTAIFGLALVGLSGATALMARRRT